MGGQRQVCPPATISVPAFINITFGESCEVPMVSLTAGDTRGEVNFRGAKSNERRERSGEREC